MREAESGCTSRQSCRDYLAMAEDLIVVGQFFPRSSHQIYGFHG